MPHIRAGLLLALVVPWGAVHAQLIFRGGFEGSCDVDADGDRVVDCLEFAKGLKPDEPDTDGDGLKDGDELFGTLAGLDLPAMGVDPRHKDLLVEMDWADDAYECAQHSHRPKLQAIQEARVFYAGIPVANVDGLPGINFIADYGQGAPFTGGNAVAGNNGITGYLGSPFHQWKSANFAPNRIGYFRYQLHGHRLDVGDTHSGIGDIGGDNSIVSLYCKGSSDNVRNTVIHELGHNLGLRHGGTTECTEQQNYNSLMNYLYQFNGIDRTCDRFGDGIDYLGYSDGSRNTLVQGQLSEAAGVCPPGHPLHKAIDWNENNAIDEGPVTSIAPLAKDCDATTVADHDDYASLHVGPFSLQGGGFPVPDDPPVSSNCASPPEPKQEVSP